MNGSRTGRGGMLWKAAILGAALLCAQAGAAQEVPAMPPETEQVNINQADAETIAEMLDGIGMVRARAIVEYREQYGEFTSLEEITQVSGIGEATVSRNEGKIRFD